MLTSLFHLPISLSSSASACHRAFAGQTWVKTMRDHVLGTGKFCLFTYSYLKFGHCLQVMLRAWFSYRLPLSFCFKKSVWRTICQLLDVNLYLFISYYLGCFLFSLQKTNFTSFVEGSNENSNIAMTLWRSLSIYISGGRIAH